MFRNWIQTAQSMFGKKKKKKKYYSHPVILVGRSNFVKQSHKLGHNKSSRLRAMPANTANALSKHSWHKDCFNSVNPKAINYNFNVRTLMPTVTSTMAAQRRTALFIFSSQGVAQSGEESLFLLPASPSPCVFSGWGGGMGGSATAFSWEFHSKCSLSLVLSPGRSFCPIFNPSGKEW